MASDGAHRTRGRPKDSLPPEERRSQLVESATAFIRREGDHATMDTIAAAAGVTKPVLYAHFGDKAGLATAVAKEVGDQLAHAVAQAIDPAIAPRDQVAGAIRTFVDWVLREPHLFRFLVTATPSSGSRADIAVAQRVADEVTPAIALLFGALDRDPSDADLCAHGIAGMVYLSVERWLSAPVQDEEQLVELLTTFVWHGLLSGQDLQLDL